MALTSLLFVLFLSVVCVVNYMVPRRARYVWLLICSWAFYLYSTSGMPSGLTLDWPENFSAGLLAGLPKLLLLIGCTLFSYLCALGINLFKKLWLRRGLLILALVALLGVLCTFKYADFTLTINGEPWRFNPVLPLGLSYYTLQVLGYVMDVYNGRIAPEVNPVRYALFASFFPGISVGPINRAPHMLPQYKLPAKFEYGKVAGGLFRVLWGIFKKMVIADNLAVFTAHVYREPDSFSGPMLALAALLFIYQLYADFSGSCDIGIGAAKMLGFDFMENFNRPFAAKTFADIWRRWHISLTSWFRDYLYIPLGGNRKGKVRQVLNMMAVFLLSGMWHGATWHYVLWGLVNGVIMVTARLLNNSKEKLVAHIPVYRTRHLRGFVQRVVTYLMFAFVFIFFAAGLFNTPLGQYFQGLFAGWGSLADGATTMAILAGIGLPVKTILVLAAAILLVELLEKFGVSAASTMADWIRTRWFFIRWPLYYLLLAAILFFGAFGGSAFIYQQY